MIHIIKGEEGLLTTLLTTGDNLTCGQLSIPADV